jgi:hypothetical protein
MHPQLKALLKEFIPCQGEQLIDISAYDKTGRFIRLVIRHPPAKGLRRAAGFLKKGVQPA